MVGDDLDASVIAEVYRLLPGKNCGNNSPCGFPKCAMFADAVVRGKKKVHDCPYIDDDRMQDIVLIVEDYFRV